MPIYPVEIPFRRSGAAPDSKYESRWVTGPVGGLHARSALHGRAGYISSSGPHSNGWP